MKSITIEMDEGRGNFHNVEPINIKPKRIKRYNDPHYGHSWRIWITPGQARRIQNHFCGMTDCECGSGPTIDVDNVNPDGLVYFDWSADR